MTAPVLCMVLTLRVVVPDKEAKPCKGPGWHRGREADRERIPAELNPPMGRGVCDEV